MATFTGLSYAELASRFPKAGAEYIYIQNSFGKTPAFLTGWLIIAGNVIGAATVALGFANYFNALFHITPILTAIVVVVLSGAILLAGVKETASVTILFTFIEIIGLIIIIYIGIPYYGTVDYLQLAKGFDGVLQAGVLIFFSYIGFQGITRLAEKAKNPEKNIPKAIIISLIITTVIYILVALSAVSVLPWNELAQQEAPLAAIAQTAFGQQSFLLLSGIALFSTFNTALMMLLGGSRIVYGIAKEKGLPSIFAAVSKRFLSPWIAILGVTVFSIGFVLIGDLKSVANLTNFTVFAVFVMINASLIYFRRKKPISTGFRTPFAIGKLPVLPLLGIVTSILMISSLSRDILLIGIGLIVIGYVIYRVLKQYRLSIDL